MSLELTIENLLLDSPGRNSYHISMKATVSEKGQVTIPKPLRQRLGIKAGQVLEFSEEKGRLIAKKAASVDPVSSVTGVIKTGLTTDQMMKLLRGKKEG